MDVTCSCGKTFEAHSSKARYCSDRCRKRKNKGDELAELAVLTDPRTGAGAVEAATARDLEEVGRLDSPLGQACLVLARRLDSPGLDTGSAISAVAARLEALLTVVKKGAGAASAPQQLRDELAARRQKHA